MGNYPQYSHHPYISFPGLRVPWYPGHRHRRRWRVRAPRPLDQARPFFYLFIYFFRHALSLIFFFRHALAAPPGFRIFRLGLSTGCSVTPFAQVSIVKTPSFHLSCCACALSARVRLPPAGVNAGLICSRAPFFAAWGASAACLNQPNLGHY